MTGYSALNQPGTVPGGYPEYPAQTRAASILQRFQTMPDCAAYSGLYERACFGQDVDSKAMLMRIAGI